MSQILKCTKNSKLYFATILMFSISSILLSLCGINSHLQLSFVDANKKQLRQHKSLREIYLDYKGPHGFHHWVEYAEMYEENISFLRKQALKGTKNLKMLEIGVQSGGSIDIWREYFNSNIHYVGIDINPPCKKFESLKNNIHVEVGSQSDEVFLADICKRYGPFDFIVDDGGHTTALIMPSLNVLWSCLRDKGVYAIEDLHAMNMLALNETGRDVYHQLADWMRATSMYFKTFGLEDNALVNHIPEWSLTKAAHIASMKYYDSTVFLHYRAEPKAMTEFKAGVFIPYNNETAALTE